MQKQEQGVGLATVIYEQGRQESCLELAVVNHVSVLWAMKGSLVTWPWVVRTRNTDVVGESLIKEVAESMDLRLASL